MPFQRVIRAAAWTSSHILIKERSLQARYASRLAATPAFPFLSLLTSPAGARGGAIILLGSGVANTISSSTFTGNKAELTGGAVTLSGARGAVLSDCTFVDNTAREGGGGALWVTLSTGTIVAGCTFVGNSNFDKGGAIYLLSSVAATTLRGLRFSGNAALTGGALACENRVSTVPSHWEPITASSCPPSRLLVASPCHNENRHTFCVPNLLSASFLFQNRVLGVSGATPAIATQGVTTRKTHRGG